MAGVGARGYSADEAMPDTDALATEADETESGPTVLPRAVLASEDDSQQDDSRQDAAAEGVDANPAMEDRDSGSEPELPGPEPAARPQRRGRLLRRDIDSDDEQLAVPLLGSIRLPPPRQEMRLRLLCESAGQLPACDPLLSASFQASWRWNVLQLRQASQPGVAMLQWLRLSVLATDYFPYLRLLAALATLESLGKRRRS